MSKRKSPTTSKNARRAAIAKQAIAKSPKRGPVASARHSSALTPLKRELSAVEIPETRLEVNQKLLAEEDERFHESPKDSPAGEDTTASAPTHLNDLQQEAPVVEISEPSQQDRKLSDKETKGFDIFSATANMQAYQAKLLEISSANIYFAFDYAQRLATVGSPVEVLTVNSEFTSKRIAMFLKHSKQMAELILGRSRLG
jgi:hypothetical protein